MKSSRSKTLFISILFCALAGLAYQNCGNIEDMNQISESGVDSDLTDTLTTKLIPLCKGDRCYKVGGKIGGLSGGTVQLSNNGYTLNITATSTVSFQFPQAYAAGNPYNVTISQQPPTQTCTVAQGTGIFPSSNVTSVVVKCVNSGWTPLSIGNSLWLPSARIEHGAVWTGSKMIIWGGVNGSTLLNDGGIYDLATSTWTAISNVGAPSARGQFQTIWTGSKMIIWGGQGQSAQLNDGGIYNPTTNSWSSISTTGAPSPRYLPSAVWTGSKMIIWGGYSLLNNAYVADGAAYDPATNTWSPISNVGAPSARNGHVAVWTGSQMIVWGGQQNSGGLGLLNDGKIYNPTSNTWAAMTASPLSGRAVPNAVWTGSQMIVWTGDQAGSADGALYNPTTGIWTMMSTVNATLAMFRPSCVWTGSKMIIWRSSSTGDSGVFDPQMNAWSNMNNALSPAARMYHSTVWTGSKMIVWGGSGGINGSTTYNDGWVYTP